MGKGYGAGIGSQWRYNIITFLYLGTTIKTTILIGYFFIGRKMNSAIHERLRKKLYSTFIFDILNGRVGRNTKCLKG